MAQVEAAVKAGEARVGELEQQVQALDSLLQGANADVTRLRSELAAREAIDRRSAGPIRQCPRPLSRRQPARQSGGGRGRAGGGPACADPLPEPESLAITFEVNSSYLPASLDGRLRELAEGLERRSRLRGRAGRQCRQRRGRRQVGRRGTSLQPLDGRAPGEPRRRVPAEERQVRHADDQAGLRAQRPVTPGTGRGPAALGLAQAGGTGRGRRCSSMATKVNSAPVT